LIHKEAIASAIAARVQVSKIDCTVKQGDRKKVVTAYEIKKIIVDTPIISPGLLKTQSDISGLIFHSGAGLRVYSNDYFRSISACIGRSSKKIQRLRTNNRELPVTNSYSG